MTQKHNNQDKMFKENSLESRKIKKTLVNPTSERKHLRIAQENGYICPTQAQMTFLPAYRSNENCHN